MPEINSYTPLPKQEIFHKSKCHKKFGVGGYGCGKSEMLCWEAIDLCMKFPGNVGLIARKYNEDLPETTMKSFYDACPPELIANITNSGRYCEFINGSVIMFFGLYTKQKTRLSKVGSLNLGFFCIDEAYECSEQDYLLLIGRLRLAKVPERYAIVVSNPPNIDHWIYKKAVENPDPDTLHVQFSTYDNPFLPHEYIENMEKSYPDSWVKRFIRGEYGFVTQGYPVYSGFGEDTHVRTIEYNPYKTLYRGWDFGWHRPAVVWCQVDDSDRFCVIREYMGDKIYLEDFAPKVIAKTNQLFPDCKVQDFCDIAGTYGSDKKTLTSVQILNQPKFDIHPRSRYTQVGKGIEIIQRKINTVIAKIPAFSVDSSCRVLKEAFLGGYYYSKDVNGVPSKDPEKEGYYEHLMDAVRYIIVNLYSNLALDNVQKYKPAQPSFFSEVMA